MWRRVASPPSASMRVVEVRDSEGPREAAVEYAIERELAAGSVVCVREIPTCRTVTRETMWAVEPVTTYRARPA